jgi:membrane protease YdiL (CAAX protease family)
MGAELAAARPRLLPRDAAREALAVWALCFGAVVIAFLLYRPAAKIVATVGFLYLPLWASGWRGEDWPEYGLTLQRLGADVRLFLLVSAVVFPLFIGGYVLFTWAWPQLPDEWARILTPYAAPPRFEPRLPERFEEWIIDDLFVVALPEEFFYRGYLQTRLRDAWPRGRLFFGARLGRAFWLTALLFALGHLAIFQVWRLAVFFPALLFGWMRERSHSVLAPALFHAAANLLIKVLDASFFGR